MTQVVSTGEASPVTIGEQPGKESLFIVYWFRKLLRLSEEKKRGDYEKKIFDFRLFIQKEFINSG